MEPIKKFIECLLPVTACNLKCEYCYVMQEDRRKMCVPELDYDMDTIQYALRRERFFKKEETGTCYVSICGAGETMMPDYIVELSRRILENGYYLNLTSNGTITKRYDEIVETFPEEALKRMHFAFSLHYLELERLKLLDRFFCNVRKVRDAGCSIVVQLNMYDGYMDRIEEIKERCMKEVGAWPQIAVTRREDGFPVRSVTLHTNGSPERYIEAGQAFQSPLFDFTLKNFRVRRKEFCYAGSWSYQLNLKTGLLKRCYCSCVVQNIFKNTETPIFDLPVGHACNSLYCNNSSHFISQGVIPSIKGPTYAQLRDRPEAHWYTSEMREALSHRLDEVNPPCGPGRKALSGLVGLYDRVAYRAYEALLARKSKQK